MQIEIVFPHSSQRTLFSQLQMRRLEQKMLYKQMLKVVCVRQLQHDEYIAFMNDAH